MRSESEEVRTVRFTCVILLNVKDDAFRSTAISQPAAPDHRVWTRDRPYERNFARLCVHKSYAQGARLARSSMRSTQLPRTANRETCQFALPSPMAPLRSWRRWTEHSIGRAYSTAIDVGDPQAKQQLVRFHRPRRPTALVRAAGVLWQRKLTGSSCGRQRPPRHNQPADSAAFQREIAPSRDQALSPETARSARNALAARDRQATATQTRTGSLHRQLPLACGT